MNRRRLINVSRIAWTAWWGIVCVLLVVLRVRSYQSYDTICYVSSGHVFGFAYARGTIGGGYARQVPPGAINGWNFLTEPLRSAPGDPGFSFSYRPTGIIGIGATAPLWFLVLCGFVISAAPWFHKRWRFSLLALLIATTLVSLLLGLVMWLISS